MAKELDRMALLQQLERVKFDKHQKDPTRSSAGNNLGKVLLNLAEVDAEHEHQLCEAAARHLVGTIPSTQDDDVAS